MVAEAAPLHWGHVLHHEEEGLLGLRRSAHYNEAERRYSILLYRRIEELLKGQRNSLLVLRRYPNESSRLGVMSTPVDLDRSALRIPIVEKMAMDALVFLSEHSTGGPVAQESGEDGRVVETRKFPTKFPHIIIERVDVFRDGAQRPESIEWSARRVQNQRTSTRINRMLDAANLGVDLVKLLL
jgi:hypothetical protein